MKVIQKYFLALIPPPEILEKAHQIKIQIQDRFGIKYALKSPPHITLKMPFNYNESKEAILEEKIRHFLKDQKPFRIQIDGIGTFGKRVIYLNIKKCPELMQFQTALKTFCKKELNLIDELSDRNYHPHLTVAFKDLKAEKFDEVLSLVNEHYFSATYDAVDIAILKRREQKWILHKNLGLKE